MALVMRHRLMHLGMALPEARIWIGRRSAEIFMHFQIRCYPRLWRLHPSDGIIL